MRFSTLIYCLKQGLKNVAHNKLFSLASMATIGACIFLFCLFFAIVSNVQNMAKTAETTVGITVFFEEGTSDETVQDIGEQISARPEVKEVIYTSAEEAWESFQQEYFGENADLAAAFAEDNPLADSESYEIFLYDISEQTAMVDWLNTLEHVRQVNYSNAAVSGLSSVNKIIGLLSAVIIAVLLAVAVFLISNTISVAAQFRKRENEIMRLIGATNFMIRFPFVVEGVLLGLIGALVPLAAIYYLYEHAAAYVLEHFVAISGLFTPIPIGLIYPKMVVVALTLGVGIGFIVSFLTIRRQLKV